jgi:hypothetical protein
MQLIHVRHKKRKSCPCLMAEMRFSCIYFTKGRQRAISRYKPDWNSCESLKIYNDFYRGGGLSQMIACKTARTVECSLITFSLLRLILANRRPSAQLSLWHLNAHITQRLLRRISTSFCFSFVPFMARGWSFNYSSFCYSFVFFDYFTF